MGILGLFEYADNLLEALGKLREGGMDVEVISPVPLVHEIEHKFGEGKNPVKYFTLLGAIGGLFGGAFFVLGTAAMYILPRSGKPLFAATPTLLMSYETTILAGVVMTLIGFLFFSKLPAIKKVFHAPELAVDSFGLYLEYVREDKVEEVEKILADYGAEVKKIEQV